MLADALTSFGRAYRFHRTGIVSLAGLLTLATLGCEEHRISYDEFLDMQAEAQRQAVPTTQPAEAKAAARATIDQQLGPYRVGAGDVLLITVNQMDQEPPFPPVQARVDRDGAINLPGVGNLRVAGLELEDVEKRVHEAFVPNLLREAAVNATVLEPEQTKVLVVGAATTPGLVQLRRTDRNLLYAIVDAGGMTELASGQVTLRRLRDPEQVVTLNLRDPQGLRAALSLDPLENGDIVQVVAAQPNTIFVGGLVMAPAPQVYPAGTEVSILQAIAAAGGLRIDVTPREATLIRRQPDGTDIHVKLDLDRITTGKDPNIRLAAGDILWVPQTVETFVEDWINRNIYIRGGFAANVSYSVTGVEYMNRRNQQSRSLSGGTSLENAFDPFGFLVRDQVLRGLTP